MDEDKYLAFDESEDEFTDNQIYDERNEDNCYEFGGIDDECKSNKSSLTENIIALAIVIAFVAGVFYYAFNCL